MLKQKYEQMVSVRSWTCHSATASGISRDGRNGNLEQVSNGVLDNFVVTLVSVLQAAFIYLFIYLFIYSYMYSLSQYMLQKD